MSEIPALPKQQPTDVAALIANAAIARNAAQDANAAKLAEDVISVLGCRRHPRHVGLIFYSPPRGSEVIDGTMWTGVREPGVPQYWGTAEGVVCLQCVKETGERTPLPIAEAKAPHPSMGFCFTLPREWRERFVHQLSRKALAEYLPKSETPRESKPTTDDGRPAKPAARSPAA